jgi:hypothetical protein
MSLLWLSVPTVCGNQLLQQSAACHTKRKLQCAPHKLRHLIIEIVSSTEIATSGKSLCVWLAFVLLLTVFHHPKAKTFCLANFLTRKKTIATLQASFLFFARKLAKQNIFALG